MKRSRVYLRLAFLYYLPLFACSQNVQLPEKHALVELGPNTWQAKSLGPNVNAQCAANSCMAFITLGSDLQALVDEALRYNSDLRIAASRVASLNADSRSARAVLWPSLSASMDQYQQKLNSSSETKYSARLSASWEVDIWQKLANSVNAAEHDLAQQQALYQAARQSLIAQVLLTWLDTLEAQKLLQLAEKNLDLQETRKQQLESRMDQGIADVLDVRLVRNNVANLRNRYLQQDSSYTRSLRELEGILGRYPNAELATPKNLPTLPPLYIDSAPADILHYRPDIVALEQNLRATKLRVQEAKKRLWPQLSLSANYSHNDPALSNLFDFDHWLSQFVAALAQPIFQGGSLRANVAQHKAKQDIALEQYRQAVLEAWKEVENYVYSDTNITRRQQALSVAWQEAAAAEVLTEKKYEQGLVNSFELLSAQNRSTNAEAELIEINIAAVANRIRLQLALGRMQSQN